MKRSRLKKGFAWSTAVLAVLFAIAFAIVYVQGRREPKGKPEYVALGSSFAAGAGLGALQAASPTLCARSVGGYPQQLARMLELSIVDMSCGGAVTRDVLRGGQFFQGPQIRVITPETRLVTMTVGGNDVGYIGDLSQSAARRTGTAFGRIVKLLWSGPKTPSARRYDVLQRELDATLRAIRAKAPGAVVVVATYPTILPRSIGYMSADRPRRGRSRDHARRRERSRRRYAVRGAPERRRAGRHARPGRRA